MRRRREWRWWADDHVDADVTRYDLTDLGVAAKLAGGVLVSLPYIPLLYAIKAVLWTAIEHCPLLGSVTWSLRPRTSTVDGQVKIGTPGMGWILSPRGDCRSWTGQSSTVVSPHL